MGKTFVYNDGKGEEERGSLALQFGMFFDGTLNSKENTRIREVVQANNAKDWERELCKKHGGTPEDDVSFQNDYTNVARMQMSCNEDYVIYVEGIGTEAIPKDIESQGQKERKNTIENLGDKQEGFAMGSGPTGIRAKVRRGCELLLEEINPWNKIGHAKFREYAFIKISKEIYEKYKNSVIGKYGSSISYGDDGSHSKLAESIEKTQKHKHILNSKGNKKIKYLIPEAVFLNNKYWQDEYFYYETKIKNVTEGIVATNSYSQTIFWKIEKL